MRLLRIGLLLAGPLAYFVVAVLWLGSDVSHDHQALFGPGSVYDGSGRGVTLAFAYLRDRLGPGRVRALSRELGVANLDPEAVLFRFDPVPGAGRGPGETATSAGPLLLRVEESWVRTGGRLVLLVSGAYRGLRVEAVGAGRVQKVYSLWPGVHDLRVPERVLAGVGLSDTYAVFTLDDRPVVARRRLGAGDVILLACPEIFENQGLGSGHHLELLEHLVAGRPVFFDERAHGLGLQTGLLVLLADWGLGPLLLCAALTAALFFWRLRARTGPPVAPPSEAPAEAVELVDSLGRLYDRALSRAEALRLYRRAFVDLVAERTGLRRTALARRVREMLGNDPKGTAGREATPAELSAALRRLTDGFRRLTE